MTDLIVKSATIKLEKKMIKNLCDSGLDIN